jgi:2-methylcitrate dehydratase PrpD
METQIRSFINGAQLKQPVSGTAAVVGGVIVGYEIHKKLASHGPHVRLALSAMGGVVGGLAAGNVAARLRGRFSS